MQSIFTDALYSHTQHNIYMRTHIYMRTYVCMCSVYIYIYVCLLVVCLIDLPASRKSAGNPLGY